MTDINLPTEASNKDKPFLQRILPDIAAFTTGLTLAWYLNWQTTDLVWSLWLCSLVLGYLTLLSALGGSAFFWLHVINHKDFEAKYRTPAMLVGIAIGVFYLGFFSFHFGGFHAGHSVFLQQFFPLENMPEMGFGEAFMNPPLLWRGVFEHLLVPYGVFLLPAIMAERKHLLQPLIKARKTVHSMSPGFSLESIPQKLKSKNRITMGDAMGRPYINVVRMHLLIFFFAFCHFLIKVDSFFVYAAVYSVYFFPWAEIKQLRNTRSKPAAAG